ncbi:MAG: HNH endonuclease signature motif containing protein [Minicystis sp.]
MTDRFPQDEAIKLLAKCHRRCCICHRFCGVKMELDHMQPIAEGGASTIDNAIPVCFECHAEIHAYNNKHPRGRKFQPAELKLHKEQWISFCENNPGALAQMPADVGVGPLQALLDEIEFNLEVASRVDAKTLGCPLTSEQFRRAIQTGAMAVLDDQIKAAVNAAYADVGRANHFLLASHPHPVGSNAYNTALADAQQVIMAIPAKMKAARDSDPEVSDLRLNGALRSARLWLNPATSSTPATFERPAGSCDHRWPQDWLRLAIGHGTDWPKLATTSSLVVS